MAEQPEVWHREPGKDVTKKTPPGSQTTVEIDKVMPLCEASSTQRPSGQDLGQTCKHSPSHTQSHRHRVSLTDTELSAAFD